MSCNFYQLQRRLLSGMNIMVKHYDEAFPFYCMLQNGLLDSFNFLLKILSYKYFEKYLQQKFEKILFKIHIQLQFSCPLYIFFAHRQQPNSNVANDIVKLFVLLLLLFQELYSMYSLLICGKVLYTCYIRSIMNCFYFQFFSISSICMLDSFILISFVCKTI